MTQQKKPTPTTEEIEVHLDGIIPLYGEVVTQPQSFSYKFRSTEDGFLVPKIHSPECLAAKQLDDVWVVAHPNHCKECSGRGEFTTTDDPSPAGISLGPGSMTFTDLCDACSGQGICPLCGETGLVEEDDESPNWSLCSKCGEDYQKEKRPGIECFCPEPQTESIYEQYSDIYEER